MRFVGDEAEGRGNNFNLLRMIAASGVVISHGYLVTGGEDAIQPLQRLLYGLPLGTVSVYAFFTISGFLITRSYQHDPRPDAFVLKRAARLLPALIVVTFASVLLGAALTTRPLAEFMAGVPEFVVRNLSLISFDQGLPGVFANAPYGSAINPPLWSLPYEVGCYLAVLLLGLSGALKHRRALAFAAVLFVPVLILSLFGIIPRFPDLVARYGFAFLLGALVWLWREWVPLSPLILALAWLAAVFGAATVVFFNVFLQIAIAYTVFYLAYTPRRRLLAYNSLGDYSYGTYLFGFPIQQAVYLLGLGVTPLSNIAVAFPLTIICAACSWHLVEQPVLTQIKLALHERPVKGASAAVPPIAET